MQLYRIAFITSTGPVAMTINCCIAVHISDLLPMSVGCFNKENDVDGKVEGQPNHPGEVVSEIMQPHPVWQSFDPPPPSGLLVWLKPVCSTTTIMIVQAQSILNRRSKVYLLPEGEIFN